MGTAEHYRLPTDTVIGKRGSPERSSNFYSVDPVYAAIYFGVVSLWFGKNILKIKRSV